MSYATVGGNAIVNPVGILSTTNNINALVQGGTVLYTVPTGNTAYITGCNVRCTSATSITNGPVCGVGTTTGTDNIFASIAITLLTAISKAFSFSSFGMGVAVAAGATVVFNVDVVAVGSLQTLSADLIGYLV